MWFDDFVRCAAGGREGEERNAKWGERPVEEGERVVGWAWCGYRVASGG